MSEESESRSQRAAQGHWLSIRETKWERHRSPLTIPGSRCGSNRWKGKPNGLEGKTAWKPYDLRQNNVSSDKIYSAQSLEKKKQNSKFCEFSPSCCEFMPNKSHQELEGRERDDLNSNVLYPYPYMNIKEVFYFQNLENSAINEFKAFRTRKTHLRACEEAPTPLQCVWESQVNMWIDAAGPRNTFPVTRYEEVLQVNKK